MKRVLLLEPNYQNKYPPMGLMKLAMYHRLQGWDVVFYKGDLKEFVVTECVRDSIVKLERMFPEIYWAELTPDLRHFFLKGKIKEESRLEYVLNKSEDVFLQTFLTNLQRDYKRGAYFLMKPWDRVCVTTLFTFYWKITVETIEFAKKIVKDQSQIMVGGVLASVRPDLIEKETGIKPYCGCIQEKAIFDDKPLVEPYNCSIDALPLDYSILEEVDYQYPETNAYYAYTTRGCVNHCKFCVVPTIEPEYQEYIPLSSRIKDSEERFGKQRDLLLLDNNVFASPSFNKIIDEIRDAGFGKGSKIIPSNQLDIIIARLKDGWNDRAYIRKGVKFLQQWADSLKGSEGKEVSKALLRYNLTHDYTADKETLLTYCESIREQYAKSLKKTYLTRHVDFNQGVDARRATEERIKKISEIALKPLRVAFDDWELRKQYVQAIYYASKYGIEGASNYLLYNFKDKPIDLYNRLLLNIDLSFQLGINIYSFPMKYHPIRDEEWMKNRDYIGVNWSRKKIRTIQTILNSTKGKVGSSRGFFFAAFGYCEEAFEELLIMPEALILNRFDAEIAGITDSWREARFKISDDEFNHIDDRFIQPSVFNPEDWKGLSKEAVLFLNFYLIEKSNIPVKTKEQERKYLDLFEAKCPTSVTPECARLLKAIKK